MTTKPNDYMLAHTNNKRDTSQAAVRKDVLIPAHGPYTL